jgi:hypothetical protein
MLTSLIDSRSRVLAVIVYFGCTNSDRNKRPLDRLLVASAHQVRRSYNTATLRTTL